MSEFQELIDFPPAPKLGIDGKLDPRKASQEEMRGQELFFGKVDALPATSRRITPTTRCTT